MVRAPAAPEASRLWWFAGPVLASLVVALIVLAAMPVPYMVLSPGDARAVEPLITITPAEDGLEIHEEQPAEDLLFLTVSVRRPAGIEVLARLLDDTSEVVPEDVLTGGQSREENREYNQALMTDSKDQATKVALERLGYEVPTVATGATITDMDPTFPIAEVAHPLDTVVEADGTAISSADDLVAAIDGHQPGDPVELKLEPRAEGEARTVEVEMGANPDDPDDAMLGVSLVDRPEFEFPIDVSIDSGKVGGPSAGLAFTLAIIDRLSPGDLTGDEKVAVTGTIRLDGSIGQVGGVPQKTEAAVDAGATLFLVPPEEYDVAVEAARGRIDVHEARTLEQALSILEDAGGDPVPPA